MTPEIFWFMVLLGGVGIFGLLYLITPYYTRKLNWFVICIIASILITACVFAPTIDRAYGANNATITTVNYTVIDTLHELNWFVFNDYTIKLSNGEIVYIRDPYEWKSYRAGYNYSCIQTDWNSFMKGNVTEIECG
jgi:hypothetical protein